MAAASTTSLRDYKLLEMLGQGHYAVVHRAQHLPTGNLVALKKIQIFDMDSKSRKECLNEASLLQHLHHPSIVRLFDSFMEDNDLYLVLELADGGDLHRLITQNREQGRRLEEVDVWRYMYQITAALQHMHTNRIMHRDIKPTNCFLTASGDVKLGDLGLGRVLSSKSAKAQSIVGTPFYMSPEVIENQAYSYASDVWSLGCIVYEMVMGESPFYIQGNASLFLVAQKILNCSYTPIPDMYSEQLRQLVHSMIQRDSAARPTVHQIEEILRTYLSQGLANYEDLGVIGRGTHSEVHKCRCRRTNQMVAVKKVHIFEMDSSARRECVNEAKLLQTVPDHPNIIKYIESFLSGNELYLVLELAECGDLAQVVQTMRTNGQRFGELQIWRYLVQIAGALAHMHESRVMHRDLKPGNLFLMQDGCMKLGDLGLSRYFSSKTHEVFSMVGTPYYLSPEAIANEGYDFASDIWSLGCIIYELCELQSPFYAPQSNLYLLGKKIRSAEYQPLTNYSDALCRLVSQMIVVASADRPSAAQVLEYCQQALAHFTSQAAQEEAAMMLADDEYADEFVTDAEADQLSASLQLPLGNQYAPAKDRFFRSI